MFRKHFPFFKDYFLVVIDCFIRRSITKGKYHEKWKVFFLICFENKLMDVLWSPWRYAYIKSSDTKLTADNSGCMFCGNLNNPASDEEKFILHLQLMPWVVTQVLDERRECHTVWYALHLAVLRQQLLRIHIVSQMIRRVFIHHLYLPRLAGIKIHP